MRRLGEYIVYAVSRWFFFVWLKTLHFIKVYGRENIPRRDAYICTSNHVSFGDSPVIGMTFPKHMRFMAKEELFAGKKWGWWFKWMRCIPTSRNKKDFKATKIALRALKKGESLALFPEGTRSETGELKKAELGAGFIALKSKVPVIPIYIDGTRGALAPGGKYKKWVPIRVYIGRPLYFDEINNAGDKNKREKYRMASDKIMQAIAELKRLAIRD